MKQMDVLEALAKVGAARRGQISEQWYKTKNRDGGEKMLGPYYVWTHYDAGVKHTARIPAREIEKARSEIERGKEVSRLMDDFWRNAESVAVEEKKRLERKSRDGF